MIKDEFSTVPKRTSYTWSVIGATCGLCLQTAFMNFAQ